MREDRFVRDEAQDTFETYDAILRESEERQVPYRVLCGWSWYQDAETLEEAYAIRHEIDYDEVWNRPVSNPRWEWDPLGRPPMLLQRRDDGYYDEVPWPDGKTYKTAGDYVSSEKKGQVMTERPTVNGVTIGRATVAVTDGGYVLDEVFDTDGNDVYDKVERDVYVPLDAPSKPFDVEAAVLTGNTETYNGVTYLKPTVTVHPDRNAGDSNGDVALWHVGPLGAVAVIWDRGSEHGMSLTDLISTEE